MTRRARRAAGQLEAEVLSVLRAAPVPLTPSQVQVALGEPLAYNTVHTILSRLCEKGSVCRDLEGRSTYAPTQTADEWAADQMRAILDGGDRMAILHRFVTSLSPQDEEDLRTLLREEDSAG